MARKTHSSPEIAKNAILDAAEALMVDVGPAGLRISAVAKKAGMAHPNIIHHFGSREGLINALAERVGQRATERITRAIDDALRAPPEERVNAITRVLETSYHGDEGRSAVWLHLSGAESSLRSNMEQIVTLSHEFRKSMDPTASKENTNRLVMLVTLALVGEVVSGSSIKEALGFGTDESERAHFKQWLAEILLNLRDHQLDTSLSASHTSNEIDNDGKKS
ncbi:TetR/AcrR family transcriptional regulator [Arenicella sp. 4NH20-0111]|uniref:TetR/AcrR family transcriptional regulator n=1 Tax=Arenicella sp. 4NH20-0111 TaxID=3127648 RepID=UPI00310A7C4C